MAEVLSGDLVALVRLDESFFDGVEIETVEFLQTCIGLQTKVIGIDDYGHVEIEFLRSKDPYQMHTLWVDPSWVKKV